MLFGGVAPGTHDLILYDGVQEVARAPKAVVIAEKSKPTAIARVRVVGNLIDLDEAVARALRVGATYPPGGTAASEIVALGEPIQDWREIRLLDGLVDVHLEPLRLAGDDDGDVYVLFAGHFRNLLVSLPFTSHRGPDAKSPASRGR